MAPPSKPERRLRRILATNVRRRRDGLALTVEEAADRGSMHWRLWQKVEAGEVNTTLRTLIRLAEALECQVPQLFEEPFRE